MRVIARQKAFTLVELLVVIGIISVMIAMLLPAVRSVRQSAGRTRAASDLRQLMVGYTQYHMENRGNLLMGYTPPTVCGKPIVIEDPASKQQFGYPISDRYPWRLLPYCSRIWAILHSHTSLPPVPHPDDSPAVAMNKAYTLSLNPTFGINSVYVGGHQGTVFKGFTGPNNDTPNTGHHVVFRAVEVKRPASLIVFAESQGRNVGSSEPDGGMHFVTPPRAAGQRWKIENGKFVLTSGMITGLPQGRYGNRTVVGLFDGHVEAMKPEELEDMRRWANCATDQNYDFAP